MQVRDKNHRALREEPRRRVRQSDLTDLLGCLAYVLDPSVTDLPDIREAEPRNGAVLPVFGLLSAWSMPRSQRGRELRPLRVPVRRNLTQPFDAGIAVFGIASESRRGWRGCNAILTHSCRCFLPAQAADAKGRPAASGAGTVRSERCWRGSVRGRFVCGRPHPIEPRDRRRRGAHS